MLRALLNALLAWSCFRHLLAHAKHIIHAAKVDLLIPQVGGNARATNYDYTKGDLPELIDITIESPGGIGGWGLTSKAPCWPRFKSKISETAFKDGCQALCQCCRRASEVCCRQASCGGHSSHEHAPRLGSLRDVTAGCLWNVERGLAPRSTCRRRWRQASTSSALKVVKVEATQETLPQAGHAAGIIQVHQGFRQVCGHRCYCNSSRQARISG